MGLDEPLHANDNNSYYCCVMGGTVEQDCQQRAQRQITIDGDTVDSHDLVNPGSPLKIQHADQQYLLRVTRQGKLILTK